MKSRFWQLWGWPIAFGLLSATGLLSALFSDGGLGDAWSWLALGLPVLAIAWLAWRPGKTGRR